MSKIILDGKKVRDELATVMADSIKGMLHPPCLAIFQIGDRADSTAFIKAKISFGAKIGAMVKHIHLPETISQEELIMKIDECNADPAINGIIVQLPLPISINQGAVTETVDHSKDVDCLTSYNVKRWTEGGEGAFWPATTRGVKELLAYYNIDMFGKHVVVVGRSMLVGKPLASMCVNENATVTICHSKTVDLAEETSRADILLVAAGKANLIGPNHIKKDAVVIDVGMNEVVREASDGVSGRKLVGDVDFDAVSEIVSAITPVPGGVGPMTVTALYQNLIDICK